MRPESSETTTMSFAASLPYGTPLGLIANTPAFRSTADTFPNVPITSPLCASARLARHAISLSSDARNASLLLERQQALHDRREIRSRIRNASRLRQGFGGQAKGVVQFAVDPVKRVVSRMRLGIRRERLLL